MNIFMTVSDSYMPYCGIALKSALENNSDIDIDAYIVCPDLTSENKVKMERTFSQYNARVNFISLSDEVYEAVVNVTKHLKVNFNIFFVLRLFVDHLLPASVKKVLYIDADTIVSGSLLELDEYIFNDEIGVAVVKDAVRDSDYSRLKIDRNKHTYFNSGVMLINLDYWRENNVGKKCLDIIVQDENTSFMPDQDALNVVLEGKCDYLHPKYNCMTLFSMKYEHLRNGVQKDELYRVEEAVENPSIIHYVFVSKPWFKGGYLPKREIWNYYYKSSEWSDYPRYWRGGLMGCIHTISKIAYCKMGGACGFLMKRNLFQKQQLVHIRLLSLILYYGFAQWLPNFDCRFLGRLSNRIRVWCIKRLFDFVGHDVNIGRRANFGTGKNIRIGDRSNIGANCKVPSNIRIGNDVMMGPKNFFFSSFTHKTSDLTKRMVEQGLILLQGNITIGDDVWIGQECLFMPNVNIGAHSIIGARTVVTKNVSEGVVFAGNPGVVRKKRY